MYSVDLDIYSYENFRQFLKEAVSELRRTSEFSYRKFAAHAGFSSPNFILLLIQGERNLSDAGAQKVAMAFGLEKSKAQFFKTLVKFNQADQPSDRFYHAQALLKFKSKISTLEIENSQMDYFCSWRHVAIRELLILNPLFSVDDIAKTLRPKIKCDEVEKSLALLQSLNLIQKNSQGWLVNHQSLATGSDFVAASVFEYHRQMIQLSIESLDRFPRHKRNITAATASLSWDNFQMISKKIHELREEILALSDLDQNKKDVFQFNFQCFPLTETENES